MRIYTVYESSDLMSTVIPIKEGFNWIAFIFSLLWAIYNRLWVWAVFIVAANVCLVWFFYLSRGDLAVQMTAFIGLALIIGWVSNDVKRKNLTKRGFKETAILLADGKKTAVARYAIIAADRNVNKLQNRAGGPW
jgi:hypothetical protein